MFSKISGTSTRESEKSKVDDSSIISAKRYYLNKSQTKFINIGLSVEYNFEPHIQIGGKNNQSILLTEEEWNSILQYQGVISCYSCSYNNFNDPIYIQKVAIYFEKLEQIPLIKIVKGDGYIYLGNESVCKLWELVPLIDYRLDILRKQKFNTYLNFFKSSGPLEEDSLQKIQDNLSIKDHPNSENVSTMLECLICYPKQLIQKLKRGHEKSSFF